MRRERLIYLGLALITLLLYGRLVFCDFVNYDDPEYVSGNPHVQGGLRLDGVVWAFTTGHMGNWHPLTWLSHMLDWQLFGNWAGGHHLVNVLLHTANALLLLRLLQRLTGSVWRSALVAALFAWHPLRVESVAWIAERKDVLSTLFFLLAINAYVSWAKAVRDKSRTGPTADTRQAGGGLRLRLGRGRAGLFGRTPGAALGYFALGLLCKPMVVTLPGVLLLLDYWPLQRAGQQAGDSISKRLGEFIPLIREKVLFFVLGAISSAVTVMVQQHGGAVSALDFLSLEARVANAVMGYTAYLGKLVWPVNLAVLYPVHTHWPLWKVVVAGAVLGSATWAVVLGARRRPYAVVGWFWFLTMLLPVIGLVQVGLQFIADRYTYVPAVGFFLAVVWGGAELASRIRHGKGLAVVLTCGVVIACLALTVRQLEPWQDGVRLFEHTVAVTERNYIAHNNLGVALTTQKRLDEARHHFEKALEFNPGYAQARLNLATFYRNKGQFETALEQCQRALHLKPDDIAVRCMLGQLQGKLGQRAAALQTYQEAVRMAPDSARARLALGIELAEQGRWEDAVGQYQAALRHSRNAEVEYHLGNALLRMERLDEAVRHFRAALAMSPAFAEAHNNLANALAQRGDLPGAIGHLHAAVVLKPDYLEAQHNLALLLARTGQTAEAATVLERVLKLEPANETAHFELAMIHVGARRSQSAIRHLREALRLNPNSPVYANALARLLATAASPDLRQGDEAVRLAEAACAATRHLNHFYLDTLAAAHAEVGRYDDAVATQREAISLAGKTGRTNIIVEFEKHLRLYANGQPLRAPAQ
jgi:tetratricopeptide (TPR) repeat protein